jgi:hypothetical protein
MAQRLVNWRGVLWIALAAAVVAAGVRAVIGPVFVARWVYVTVDAAKPGVKWELEWQDRAGVAINGAWVDVVPRGKEGAAPERVKVDLARRAPNYRFGYVALRWFGAPGLELREVRARVREKVLGLRFWLGVTGPEEMAGTSRRGAGFGAAGPDGGVRWKLRWWSWAQVVDVAAVFGIAFLLLLALRLAYRFGPRLKGRYDPGLAALLAVIGVNVWLALRAPMVYCPDSVDYAVNALRLAERPGAEYFGPWRLPGYSVFLWPMVKWVVHFNTLLGWVQAVLAVLTAWLAGRIVRRLVGPAWGALAVLLVGMDPVLWLWTRHAMPEVLCGLLATVIAWAVMQGRFWRGASLGAAAGAALGLGVVGAGLCYVRGNFQVLAVMAPFAVAAGSFVPAGWGGEELGNDAARRHWRARERLRAMVLALAMLAGTAACLAPWMVRNYREYGRAELVVGSGYSRAMSLLVWKAMDVDQAGAFPREQWERWRGGVVMDEVMEGLRSARQTGGTTEQKAWAEFDRRAAEAARESMARDPARRWKTSGTALARLLGLWLGGELPEYDWTRPLRGPTEKNLNHWAGPEAFGHLPGDKVGEVLERTTQSTRRWVRSGEAAVYAPIYDGVKGVRPLWAGLFLVGLVGALVRREWGLLIVGLAGLAHAGVLAVLLMNGSERYQAPWYPVMTVAACYGLAWVGSKRERAEGEGARESGGGAG